MARRITDIVSEGQALGVVGGVAASIPLTDDQTAAQVPATPGGSRVGTNVQAQLAELDTSKLSDVDIADLTATGTPSASTYLRGDNTWATPAGGVGGVGAVKKARRTGTNISLNSTSWANVDTSLDLVLACQAGDQLTVGLSAFVQNENVQAFFDVVTVVGGSPLNSFGKQGAVEASPGVQGISAWNCIGAIYWQLSGETPPYTVVSGDLSGGAVTLRLRYATQAAATRVLYNSINNPIDVWVKNHGPLQT